MRKSIVAVAAAAGAAVALAGLAPAALSADGVAVSKAIVAKYSVSPTSIGNLPPITKPIPKGKYLITITNATDAAITLNNNIVAGGKMLGWKVEALQAESTLEGQRKTLQQAIAKKPDGIAVSGMETDSYGDLYKQAAAKGIAIICSACMSKPGSGLIDSHISGPKMLDLWGQMIAAFTVANVQGTPNVQMFGISVYPMWASRMSLRALSVVVRSAIATARVCSSRSKSSSATWNANVASEFAGLLDDDAGHGVFFALKTRSAVGIEQASGFRAERELVLRKGLRFRVALFFIEFV
mgnify:CR=1 FL=1